MMGKDKGWSDEMECCQKHFMSKEHLKMKKEMLEEKLKWVNEKLKEAK